MAIQSASATLQSTASLITITGFVNYQQGILDPISGTIKAQGTGRWGALSGSSWSAFTSYTQIQDIIKWTAPVIDLGVVDYFTLNIATEFDGSLSFIIYVSETGEFRGEEQEYNIQDGDINVPSFYGQYVYVTAIVTGSELRRMTTTAGNSKSTFSIPNVDSSTLSGPNTARVIPLTKTVSQITDIKIQPKSATAYPVNLYVSDTATSVVVIPVVTSKSATSPSFALYGIDNEPRDAVVDITVTALPRQVMFGGNLLVLE